MTLPLLLSSLALVLFTLLGALGLRTQVPAKLRLGGLILLVLAVSTAAWTTWLVAGAPAPLETAVLHDTDDALTIAPTPLELAVRVRTEAPPSMPGQDFSASYALTVDRADGKHALQSGSLSQHWREGKFGKTALSHLEDRARLRLDAHVDAVSIRAKDLADFAPAGLAIDIVPAPGTPGRLLSVGLALAALGAAVDRRTGSTRLAASVLALAIFSAAIQAAVTPHGEAVYVVHAALLALFGGLSLGWMLGLVLGALPGVSPVGPMKPAGVS